MSQFEKFLAVQGPALKCRPASADVIQKYTGILPGALIEHWREMGWCGYGQGLLWVLNPDDLRDPIAEWLGPASERSHAIVRTGLGDVIFWSDKGASYLDVNDNVIFEMGDDIEGIFRFSLCDDDYLENAVSRKVFRQGLRRLGVLEPDECYAFTPALVLGGPGTAETLERVKVREHLSILAQLHKNES